MLACNLNFIIKNIDYFILSFLITKFKSERQDVKKKLLKFILCLLSIFIITANQICIADCKIIVDKGTQTLWLLKNRKVIAQYPISLGMDSYSDKRQRGDCATPEGAFYVTYKKPDAKFYLFIGISYPNKVDAWWAYRRGIIKFPEMIMIWRAIDIKAAPPSNTPLGGAIGIHGGGLYRQYGNKKIRDWTEGCIALNNSSIANLYQYIRQGDQVLIYDSKKDFFSMMKPFANPVKPSGSYDSKITFHTILGKIVLHLKQTPDYSRSLEILWLKNRQSPIVIYDKNADGYLGFQDKITGISNISHKAEQSLYRHLRRVCIEALKKGQLSTQ